MASYASSSVSTTNEPEAIRLVVVCIIRVFRHAASNHIAFFPPYIVIRHLEDDGVKSLPCAFINLATHLFLSTYATIYYLQVSVV